MNKFIEIMAYETIGVANINNENVCPHCKHRLEYLPSLFDFGGLTNILKCTKCNYTHVQKINENNKYNKRNE